MMSSGGNSDAAFDPNSLEKHQIVDATQVYPSNYYSSTTGYEGSHWITQRTDNSSIENTVPSNSTYQYDQPTGPQPVNVQASSTAGSIASASSGQASVPQEYSAYQSYPGSSDPYGYSSTGYQSYYNSYQQQPSQSYSQPVGAYQNSGAPYQPISSFQNTGSYAGPPSYSSTYYNPGGYQTHGGYQSSSYSTQTNAWSGGNYANYGHQQTSYTPDSNGAYSSATTPATSQQYHQQWADYYSQTEVTCAPGTENISASATSNLASPVPGVSSGYTTLNSQAHPPYDPSSWRFESSIPAESISLQPASVSNNAQDNYWTHGTPSYQSLHVNPQPNYEKSFDTTSSYNSFQEPLNTGPNLQYSSGQHFTHTYQPSSQIFASADNRGVSKVQIQTNPRIASNLPLGRSKTDKENTVTTTTTKPAYISVSIPNPMHQTSSYDVADSVPKTDVFPKSLLGYVERALARCKDDNQRAASQTVLKEMITRATADGTLNTLDWDIQPLFPLPDADFVSEDTLRTNMIPSFTKPKRSPTRRSKSRWEPIPEEKPVDKPQTVSPDIFKFGGWLHTSDKDRKLPSVKLGGKENGSSNFKFTPEKKPTSKNVHRPFKKQRFGVESDAANNGDGSSDNDKEQSLTAYYSGAIALSKSPEERKRRESRSKRFEKGHGQRTEINHLRSKTAGPGNLFTKRASASLLSKTFEDSSSRAVEDIDWDALTVKGTCQEIEKRYLRLTSAPDPTTVRPEEVLEKALDMVQNSQRNYLYKCDQLKSIRQDLTVQRIRNHLTVKVYETHGRLALEAGDLPEYNQCQSQLKTLYAEGIEGCHKEFSAYNLLCVIIHPNKHRELVSSMSRLSVETKKDKAVQHALAVRAAVTSGNYVNFFRLYKNAPYLHTCLMDLYVEKMRYEAVKCMTRSYRPTVSVMHIAQVLGFTGVPSVLESQEKDADGLDECIEWLKAHGGCLVADNNGEMQLDTKASSTSLYMPEPEDAVAHGDANLAVNDFFTRATS